MVAQRGELPAALDSMAKAERSVSSSTVWTIRIPFYTRYAELLLQAGRLADAQRFAIIASREAENSVGQVLTNAYASAKQHEGARAAHVALVEALLSQHQDELALRTWEWFRCPAAWRAGPARTELNFDTLPRPPPGELVIVIARLRSNYVVWSVPSSNQPIIVSRISVDPLEAEQVVHSFHALCADPDSSLVDTQVMGAGIYRRLFRGMGPVINSASTLRLHLDETLRSLPVDALVMEDHVSLGKRHAVLLLAEGWPLHPLVDRVITGDERALIVQGPTGGSGGLAYLPIQYNESKV